MRHLLLCRGALAAGLLALAGSASAGRKSKPPPEVVAPPEPAVQAPMKGLFPAVLAGLDPGGLPQGLPSISAQACNACHYESHDGWAASAHSGQGSAAWRTAVAEIGNEACTSCHQPLAVQRPLLFGFDAGDVNAVVTRPNPAFDATLHLEGVTCAACHVREGKIVAASPVSESPPAHPAMGWSDELTAPAACASCHQLSWPGAAAPLYDTFGEWERSDYARAGVGCTSCHLGAAADGGAVRHELEARLDRALTVEIAVPTTAIARGAEPFAATVRLTNTGAGHSVPTGSPWRALQVEILLQTPGPDGPVEVARQDHRLERGLLDASPWLSGEDSRLAVGERRELPWTGALDGDAGLGPWTFVVRVREVVRGVPAAEPALERRLPLRVD